MHIYVLASGLTDVRPGLIFWTLVTFIIVAVVLKKVAWAPILKAVEDREKQIANAIESAKRERAEAEKLLADQKGAAEKARQEAASQLRQTQSELQRFRDELIAKSQKEAEALKAEARQAIDEERNKARGELRKEAASLAIQIAEKLLAEKLDDSKHRALAEQFVSDLNKSSPAQPRA